MFRRLLSGLLLATLLAHVASAASLELLGHAELQGKLVEPGELSGAALHGNLLLVCADEGARLDVLARRSPNRYEALTPLRLLENEQAEIDLEGLASDGRHVYVVGSHSRVRKKIDNNVSQQANRRRLGEVNRDSNRCHLFRLGIGADGSCQQKESLSLQEIFERDPLLGPFTKIPGKENGVDVEGLAVRDGKLYVGFRGPVLRGNYVPVMVLRFDAPRDYELLFVDLAGAAFVTWRPSRAACSYWLAQSAMVTAATSCTSGT